MLSTRLDSRRHWLRAGVMLALLLMLSGCGLLRTAYNNLDWFVAGRAESMLDLDQAQYDWLRGQVRDWQTQQAPALLRAYDTALERMRNQVATGMSGAAAAELLDQTENLLRQTVATTLPIMAELLHGLTPAQIDHLAEQLAEKNEEFHDKYVAGRPPERLDARADRAVNRLETWTGSLSRVQRQLVREQTRTWPDHTADWLAYRQDRQQALLALLREDADTARLEAFLRQWMVERADMPAELASSREGLREGFVQLAVVLDPTLEPGQREEIIDKIDQYRGWIDELLLQCGAQISC